MKKETKQSFEPNFTVVMSGRKDGDKWHKQFNIYAPNESRAYAWADIQANQLKVSKLKTQLSPIGA